MHFENCFSLNFEDCQTWAHNDSFCVFISKINIVEAITLEHTNRVVDIQLYYL